MWWSSLLLLSIAGVCSVLALPVEDALGITFTDIDTRVDYIAGTAKIHRANNESTITHYAIYFSSSTTDPATKLQLALGYPHQAVVDNVQLPALANPAHPSGYILVLIPPTKVPSDAASLIVVSKNADGEKADTTCLLTNFDVTALTTPLCRNATLTFPSGALDDGSGDSNYTSAVDNGAYSCMWNITNSQVSKFLFRVTYLELDPYLYDSLCVYEGDGTKIECYKQDTGASRSYNVVSATNNILVVLQVAGSISGGGFRAVYYGLDSKDYENSVGDNVMKIRYDRDYPTNCHCLDVSCQADSANCFVDEGNGKGWATCANLGTCSS